MSIPTTKLRAQLTDVLAEVQYHGMRIVVTRNGKPVAAIVPVKDLELLQAASLKKLAHPDQDPWNIQ